MSLLNQRLMKIMTESVSDVNPQEIEVKDSEDVKEDNTPVIIDKSDISDNDNTKNQLTDITLDDIKKCNTELDELEDRMEILDSDNMDTVVESIVEINKYINKCKASIEHDVIQIQAQEYKILSENANDEAIKLLINLNESSGESLWSKFIELVSSFIEKIKRASTEIAFKAVAYFDYYGKWATKYEDSLKELIKDDKDVWINGYDWKEDKLFKMSDFSKIHEFASTIIGNASSTSEMEKKLNDFESRNWSSDDVYNYILAKCVSIDPKYVKGNKNKAHEIIVNKVRGEKTKDIKLSRNLINTYIRNLKKIKSQVLQLCGSAKLSIVNPEFYTLLEDAKKELAKHSEEPESVRYRYYRTRYSILSDAQKVAMDIFYIKIRLIKEYATEIMDICKNYVKEKN